MKSSLSNWCLLTALALTLCTYPAPLPAQTNEVTAADTNTTAQIEADTDSSESTNDSQTVRTTISVGKRIGPVISFWANAISRTNEPAEAVFALGGSAKSNGKVSDAVVAIGGDATADDDVGDVVVAIGGDAIARGDVGDAVVAIAGNAEAHGKVNDAVVAFFGDVKLGSNAVVRGDVVSIGGKIDAAEGAEIKGQRVEVGMGQYPILAPLKGAADWLRYCGLKFRLLAPQPGWYWVFVGLFLILYLLISLALRRPVAACVNELQQRPATSFLFGVLLKLLLPLLLLVLAMTGFGFIVIPFVLAVAFIGALIGKAAIFEWLGGKILRLFGLTMPKPLLALLTGFVLITLLYMVPFVSLLIYFVLGLWALGVAATATFNGARKETPRPPYIPTNPPVGGTPPPATAGFVAPAATSFAAAPEGQSYSAGAPNVPPLATSAPLPTPEAYALPRAGFWERMGAALLDIILLSIVVSFIAHSPLARLMGPPFSLVVALAYFAGMWAWKGTTIGGTVLNLKVVRLDDQPVTFMVAVVRSLTSMLSFIVFFLGFFWIAFDRDKQSWHDKIAGTVVVRQPRATPLVCL